MTSNLNMLALRHVSLFCLCLLLGACTTRVETQRGRVLLLLGNEHTGIEAGSMAAIMRTVVTDSGSYFSSGASGMFSDTTFAIRWSNLSGGVTLNGMPLEHHAMYSLSSSSGWDSTQTWAITDTTAFGSFSSSIKAPGPVTIQYPSPLGPGDSIARSQGCIVKYSVSNIDQVLLRVIYMPLPIPGIEKAPMDCDECRYLEIGPVANTGSVRISPNDLSDFPDYGEISIDIEAKATKTPEYSGKKYIITSLSLASVNAYLKP